MTNPAINSFRSPGTRIAARRETVGIEVGAPSSCVIRVATESACCYASLACCKKLGLDRFRIDSGRHEIAALVAKHADDLRGEHLVENLHYGVAIGLVAPSVKAPCSMCWGPANFLAIGNTNWLIFRVSLTAGRVFAGTNRDPIHG